MWYQGQYNNEQGGNQGADGAAPPGANDGNPDPSGRHVKGAYTIWVTDRNGQLLDLRDVDHPDRVANPNLPEAEDIYYVVEGPPHPVPTVQQVDLQLNIDKVLRACQRLYLKSIPAYPEKFRIYYVRLFRIAQLGLETETSSGLANTVLASITSDLIEDEGATMKNGHLLKLGRYAAFYSAPALLIYVIASLVAPASAVSILTRLHIDASFLACFAILWTGCFIGVWLSYGIRKTKISLSDLTLSDGDYLAPHIRLLFAGLLTMIVGILLALHIVELKIGSISLTDITGSPMLAFLVGLFCGISEAALPASIGSRAATFIQTFK